ncbi:MAG: DUF5522 domain-containing protein [Planctomycetota bacterium]
MPQELLRPHPDRLAPDDPGYDEICARHAAAVASEQPLYADPVTGLWVMTAATLWRRPCCENGCRHCPHLPRR